MAYASDARAGPLARALVIRGGDPRGSRCSRPSILADEEPAGAGRRHDDPYGEDYLAPPAPAVPLWRRVRDPVPVRAAALLVPASRIDRGVRLRRSGPSGGQLPDPVRLARPPRR